MPGRALRPDALPSDTAVRFLLLVLAVASASLYLFQALWFMLRRELFVDVVQRCGTGAGELASGLSATTSSELVRQAACRADVSREQAAFAIGGALVVLGAAWLAYRLRPIWRERRTHLEPPDPLDGQALVEEVAALSTQAGLGRPPAARLDAANPGVQAFVYGAGDAQRLGMTGGLVVQQVLDPAAFRAVLRHELAHVANRDVPWTYYTVSVWWSFVGLALVPIAVIFAVSDPRYVLQLGWRSVLLALLVALVAAGVLRAREAFADAKSVAWGPSTDLDRVLAAQPAPRGRRPQLLRVHPSAVERRSLLADPDRLFRADGFTALAAGVAGGTALTSVLSIFYLVVPELALVLSVLLVAPLIAGVLCVTAWRVGLREAARGGRQPSGLPLGLGLGVGLAVAPLLTFQAANGGATDGGAGWAGYALWALGMVATTVLVARWVADSARLRVSSVLGSASPNRALSGHVVAASAVVALLLAFGQLAHLALTTGGPTALAWWQWARLPAVSIGLWLNLAPVLVAAAVVAVPLLARHDLSRTVSGAAADWPWRGGEPAPAGIAADAAARLSPPRLAPLVVIGLAAGASAAAVLVMARLLVLLVPDEVRQSDVLAVALGSATQGSVIAAAVVASVAAALSGRALWWPLGLVAGGVATLVTALGALAVVVAAGCGVLPSVRPGCGLPAWDLAEVIVFDSATRAAPLAFVLVAAVGLVRQPARPRAAGGAGDVVGTVAPVADRRWAQQMGQRSAVAAFLAVVAVVVWAGGLNLVVLAVEVPRVAGPEYVVHVPALWTGQADPATGSTGFVSTAEDVRVTIRPLAATAGATTGESVDVGGRRAFLVGSQDQGGIRVWAYDVQGPVAAYRVFVVGTPESLQRRQDELADLFAALRWVAPPPRK